MGAREGPGRGVLGERVECSAHLAAAPVDVPQQFGPGEDSGGPGPHVLVKRRRRLMRLELAGEVVVEAEEGVVSQVPRC